MNKGRKHRRGGRGRHKGKGGGGGGGREGDGDGGEEVGETEVQEEETMPASTQIASTAAPDVTTTATTTTDTANTATPTIATTTSSTTNIATSTTTTTAGLTLKQSPAASSRGAKKRSEKKSSSTPSNSAADPAPLTDDPDVTEGLVLPDGERPYVVKNSDIMGRYLVAARDLKPGEVIIQEGPLVVGPSQVFKPFCLGCYQRIEDDGLPAFRCEVCGWPLCGRECPGAGAALGHSRAECDAWAAAGLRARPLPTPLAHQAIMALRCLLLRDADPPRWRRLAQMESHNAIRREIPDLWRHNQALVVDRIREDWKMADRFSEEEIHTVCGILEVNAFEVGQHGTRALYPTAFLLAHDCVPNTNHTDDAGDFTLTVRAAPPIPRGQPITLSYAYTLQGTMKRREHLKESKFFDCICARCSDPTELGTMASALKCSKCPKGYLLSPTPLEASAAWLCGSHECGYVLDANSVRLLVERINEDLDALDANSVGCLEDFLKKYRNVLHSQHYLALSAKHSLAQLYGKAEGYTINELPNDLLARKRDICRELVRVFDVLEPGLTRLRGVCLYELHAPIMILATRSFEARAITPKQLAVRLQEVVACLEEASRILALEPPSSSEGIMGQAAADALLRMRDWHRVLASL